MYFHKLQFPRGCLAEKKSFRAWPFCDFLRKRQFRPTQHIRTVRCLKLCLFEHTQTTDLENHGLQPQCFLVFRVFTGFAGISHPQHPTVAQGPKKVARGPHSGPRSRSAPLSSPQKRHLAMAWRHRQAMGYPRTPIRYPRTPIRYPRTPIR